MTATIAPAADLDDVVRRADDRWARRHGDEPALPEYLQAITNAVRPLLGQPVAGPVDDTKVQQLLADKQRLEEAAQDEVDRLYKALTLRTKELDEARAERDTARAQLRDRPAPDTVRQKLVAAAADVTVKEKLATAASEVAQLREQLAAANRDLAAANRTLDEIADEQARPCGNHHHRFVVDLETGRPGPCECGQPWIRDFVEDDEPVAPDVEPLTALFGRIRDEAAEAGWKA